MIRRLGTAVVALGLVGALAWLAEPTGPPTPAGGWAELAPGLFRSPGPPAGYALVAGEAALLIDAPAGVAESLPPGVRRVEAVLLTHHHRDTSAAAGRFLAQTVPVRAAKLSADWLTPAGVRRYWETSLPLRDSRTAYLVHPIGLEGVDCSLADGQTVAWHDWILRVVATPGHSRDHLSFLATRTDDDRSRWLFAGDALSAPGKLWTPYTTDWDHWTDAGLKPAGESLRKLAALRPTAVLPAHGEPVRTDPVAALERTAAAVEEVAFLKSFERFTKERLGNPPSYAFLARDQVGSAGEKPWTRVSEHLYLTGNTYVLVSRQERAFLVVDPWGKRSADQVARLVESEKLGPLERVLFSHAHYDHYDGVYHLPDRDRFEVWALDQVAGPIADPYRLRAPFLDARPVRFERRFRDGDSAAWREYRFRFHHLPGQSAFSSGIEAEIDGKRCYFTADNWFHQDQYSGTGGWMGLNRSWPLPYAASAQKVLDAAPEWVLAEHGGPFEFNAEDFRRRVRWGEASATAADAVSPSGDHRHDWDPSRVHVEPVVQKGRPGETLRWTLVIDNPLPRARSLRVRVEGRGLVPDQVMEVTVPARGEARREFTAALTQSVPPGRNVVAMWVEDGGMADGTDGFFAVDVGR
jgi:glyoxylase-like metal-dependent hydrolase (beta-lactamase superfamily II)